MRLLIKGTDGKETLVTTRSLETWDGSEIVLKEVTGLHSPGHLELEARQGSIWRNRKTHNIAVAFVGPWSSGEEELLGQKENKDEG